MDTCLLTIWEDICCYFVASAMEWLMGSTSWWYAVLILRINCLFLCLGLFQLYSQETTPSSADFGTWIQCYVQWCWHGLVGWPISLFGRESWCVFYWWYDYSKWVKIALVHFFSSWHLLCIENSELYLAFGMR